MNARLIFYILFLLTISTGTVMIMTLPKGNLALPLILTSVTLVTEWVLFRSVIRTQHVASVGMNLLREQDYSSRLAKVGYPDADRIVTLFNDLIAQIKAEKLHAGEQSHLLNLLIEASPLGIISLDRDGKVMIANKSASRIFGCDIKGRKLSDIPSQIASCCASLGREKTATLRLPDNMVYRCSRHSFLDRGLHYPFFLIEILTEDVLLAEREAYGRVIRMMGHEVNNSMATINSLLTLLLDIKPWGEEDAELTEAVRSCADRTASLSKFIASYAKVVKIPPVRKERVSLTSFIERLRPFMTAMAAEKGIKMRINTPKSEKSQIGIDIPLMEQVMINIVKNSIESIADRPDGLVEIIIEGSNRLVVTDNGAGIAPSSAGNIFTPFFSTKPYGQGLGLMFVAEILRRHGATFSLATSPDDGLTRFSIRMNNT